MAATDILGRTPQKVSAAYSSDDFQLVLAGKADRQSMLIQNFNFNYAQNVTRLFDLEDGQFQAFVASRPQGQMTIANVIGDWDALVDFMQQYGDPCEIETSKTISVEIKGRENNNSSCVKQKGVMYFSQPLLVSAAVSVAVADYLVNNNMAFIYSSVSKENSTGGQNGVGAAGANGII